jgi:hypothetical protein
MSIEDFKTLAQAAKSIITAGRHRRGRNLDLFDFRQAPAALSARDGLPSDALFSTNVSSPTLTLSSRPSD